MEEYKGKIFYHLADKLLQILPDWCCGNTTVMNEDTEINMVKRL